MNDPRFEVYMRKGGVRELNGYGWRFCREGEHPNIATSGQGFDSREEARNAVVDFCRSLGLAFDGPGRPPECHNVIPPIVYIGE